MSFTPALFKKFGSSVKDLFDAKKYNVANHSLVLRTKSANGLTWTHTNDVSAAVVSELKLNYKHAQAVAEIQGSTNGEVKASVKSTKTFPVAGVSVAVEGSNGAKGQAASLDASYVKDFVAANVKVENVALSKVVDDKSVDASTRTLDASVAIGFEGVSVGASAQYSLLQSAVTDYNGAFEYKQNDLTVSAVTSKKADVVTVSVAQIVNKDVTVAAQATYGFANQAKTLTLGSTVQLDSTTAVNGTLANSGAVNVNFVHQLKSWAKVGVVSSFSATNVAAPKFGVTRTLGETSE